MGSAPFKNADLSFLDTSGDGIDLECAGSWQWPEECLFLAEADATTITIPGECRPGQHATCLTCITTGLLPCALHRAAFEDYSENQPRM